MSHIRVSSTIKDKRYHVFSFVGTDFDEGRVEDNAIKKRKVRLKRVHNVDLFGNRQLDRKSHVLDSIRNILVETLNKREILCEWTEGEENHKVSKRAGALVCWWRRDQNERCFFTGRTGFNFEPTSTKA